jgi:ubiquinone/menaquinone biosynthesis C-methylase UbiE
MKDDRTRERGAPAAPTPERKRRVPRDFDGVAARYDLLQRLNPGYRKHLRWSAERMELHPAAKILDLCCGTGLSTEALVRAYPHAEITGLDASAGMLEAARRRRALAGVRLVEGDAADPAAAGAQGPFDGILVAYGIRNLPDPDAGLRRLISLLAPGGVLAVHEYSVKDRLTSRLVWNAVAAAIIVPLGSTVGRSPELFRYLRRSVLEFDGVPELEERLRRAGFEDVRTLPMDGWQRGIVHTFLARRPR